MEHARMKRVHWYPENTRTAPPGPTLMRRCEPPTRMETNMPRRRRTRALIPAICILAFLALLSTGLAAATRCATCGNAIRGRYIKAEGKAYCSQKCYQASLPACATCGKPITGRYLKHEKKNFCSQACLDAVLPKCTVCGEAVQNYVLIGDHVYCERDAAAPRCDACGLPMTKGDELPDKRRLCERCSGRVVLDPKAAKSIYRRARREVEALTGYSFKGLPKLKLVGREKMPTARKGTPLRDVQERGYYLREEQIDTYRNGRGRVLRTETKVTETIHILYGLTPDELLCTAGHEFTHALQARSLPELHAKAPEWLKEGICQYIAAAIARRHHYAEELEDIEKSTHPAYGRGYRYLKKRFGKNNWKGLSTWLRNVDAGKLPRELPEGKQ